MKTKVCTLIFFVAFGLLTSCSSTDALKEDKKVIYADKGIIISLLDVKDSRCPKDVVCVWAGNAAVGLRITNGTTTKDFSLNTHGGINFPSEITVLNHTIELIDVLPYPGMGVIYTYDDYQISLKVTQE